MPLEPDLLKALIAAAAEQVIAAAPQLTALDQAIGDGDHGTNMKRGCQAVLAKLDAIVAKPPGEAVREVGKTLVMTVGGASGPLYGSFFMAMGDALARDGEMPGHLVESFAAGVAAVGARGRSEAGEKTMLDVLYPVLEALRRDAGQADLVDRVRRTASDAVERTVPMRATKGRASFLGERSIGHIDPGAQSSCLIVHAICTILETHP